MPATESITPPRFTDPVSFVRFLDVALVVLLAPVLLLAGVPALGYAVGAAAWLLQRVASLTLEKRARRMDDPRRAMTLNMAFAMGRAWAVAGAILAVGLLSHRTDGLTAALVVIGAFTIYLATSLILRPLERARPS